MEVRSTYLLPSCYIDLLFPLPPSFGITIGLLRFLIISKKAWCLKFVFPLHFSLSFSNRAKSSKAYSVILSNKHFHVEPCTSLSSSLFASSGKTKCISNPSFLPFSSSFLLLLLSPTARWCRPTYAIHVLMDYPSPSANSCNSLSRRLPRSDSIPMVGRMLSQEMNDIN
jgi:hypothetical protein